MKILSIIADGFEEIEFTTTYDILKRLGVEVDVKTINSTSSVSGSHGLVLKDIEPLEGVNLNIYDGLFLPGGPHYAKLMVSEKVQQTIMHFYNYGKYIFAICAAPTILGKMGLLQNKKYTCFNSMNENFGGEFIQTRVVVDDKLLTGNGPFAAMDFALKVGEILVGKEKVSYLKMSSFF